MILSEQQKLENIYYHLAQFITYLHICEKAEDHEEFP